MSISYWEAYVNIDDGEHSWSESIGCPFETEEGVKLFVEQVKNDSGHLAQFVECNVAMVTNINYDFWGDVNV